MPLLAGGRIRAHIILCARRSRDQVKDLLELAHSWFLGLIQGAATDLEATPG